MSNTSTVSKGYEEFAIHGCLCLRVLFCEFFPCCPWSEGVSYVASVNNQEKKDGIITHSLLRFHHLFRWLKYLHTTSWYLGQKLDGYERVVLSPSWFILMWRLIIIVQENEKSETNDKVDGMLRQQIANQYCPEQTRAYGKQYGVMKEHGTWSGTDLHLCPIFAI